MVSVAVLLLASAACADDPFRRLDADQPPCQKQAALDPFRRLDADDHPSPPKEKKTDPFRRLDDYVPVPITPRVVAPIPRVDGHDPGD